MRFIKMFGLAAIGGVAVMAFVGATSASATSTQICTTHTGLTCGGNGVSTVHAVLAAGTVLEILAPIPVLCLSELFEATALGLGNPQSIHITTKTASGCGTGSAHNNCTLSTQENPLANLLKISLDLGIVTLTSGRLRLQCSSLGIDCIYDAAGMELAAGGGQWTMEETATTELGGKFFCPDEGFLHSVMETLGDAYVLG